MASFEDLEVYKRARKLRIQIAELVESLPSDERYRLKDQILRSSRSISAQIAEGHGRFHYQETIQFSRVARGSLEETHDHLNTALDEGFISTDDYKHLIDEKQAVLRLLNGYIRYLQKSKRPG